VPERLINVVTANSQMLYGMCFNQRQGFIELSSGLICINYYQYLKQN